MPQPDGMQRVLIVGTSCAGKTTFGRNLAAALNLPAFDLDTLHWGPNWTPKPKEEFHAALQQVVAEECWILSGNYRETRPLVWPRLTTIIWLNYSFSTVFSRALRRTIRRIITQEEVCNGNRESIRLSFFSRDSILVWVWTTFRQRRDEYTRLIAENSPSHVKWIEFRTPRDADDFLAAVRAERSAPQTSHRG